MQIGHGGPERSNTKLGQNGSTTGHVKKVCYKVSLCEHCQRQSCKAFIGLTNCAKIVDGLTIGAKMIGGERPLLPEILSQSGRVGAKFKQ